METKVLALVVLGILVLPIVSMASEESSRVVVEILSKNVSIRGDALVLTANLTVSGDPVNFTWILPPGFEIISGVASDTCNQTNCLRPITISVGNATDLGPQVVGVEVNYG